MPGEVMFALPQGMTTNGTIGKRYMARFIDGIVAATVAGTATAIAVEAAGTAPLLVGLMVFLPVWVGYFALLECSPWQATVGKRVLGLKVYGRTGGRIGIGTAVIRSVVKEVPLLLFAPPSIGPLAALPLLLLNVIVVHRSPVYQSLHDRAAGTIVACREEITELRLNA